MVVVVLGAAVAALVPLLVVDTSGLCVSTESEEEIVPYNAEELSNFTWNYLERYETRPSEIELAIQKIFLGPIHVYIVYNK